MSEEINIRQALETAIRYEQNIRDVVRSILVQVMDERLKKILTIIAKQEQEHLDVLRKAYEVLIERGRLDKFEGLNQENRQEIENAVASIRQVLNKMPTSPKVIDTLEKLFELEKETFLFYQNLFNQLQGKQKDYFERFVQQEQKHVEMVAEVLKKYVPDISYVPRSS